MQYLNISGYKFVPVNNLIHMERKFRRKLNELGIRGTIIFAEEGMNVALAGEESAIRAFCKFLKEDERFSDIEFKESWSDTIPFRRLRIRLKNEIVTMRTDGIKPLEKTGKRIMPKELKQWLDEGKDFTFIDTRNDYEYKIGTFDKAEELDIENFRDFPEASKQLPEETKEKPLVMFCTGGIRCEKASALYMEYGFKDVYQLEGGIIKYFEECGGDHWHGDCFVFDNRVAVKPDLSETDKKYCLACLDELTEDDMKSDKFSFNKYCPHCYEQNASRHIAA